MVLSTQQGRLRSDAVSFFLLFLPACRFFADHTAMSSKLLRSRSYLTCGRLLFRLSQRLYSTRLPSTSTYTITTHQVICNQITRRINRRKTFAASPSHTSIMKRYTQIENRISTASSEWDSPNRPITPEACPYPPNVRTL